ncbi:sugar phosphate isomerase/epimerase [uncultured Methanobrevibacter sp.]|uniref:sugar phosphate isomerase/epimerase family protein n=1 Tax=uncultured Methanobrevibacter sp. TaxID=253161 RepID=UPI0025FBD452|nr:sugar phosphate isomerase/epimerase family protein [uncultured Methanobrevibacter sp.]
MKIGASTLACFKEDMKVNLDFFEENKIEYVELLYEFPSWSLDEDLLNSYNLKYTIHSPISDINIASLNPSIRNGSIKEIFNSFQIANELDIDTVVVHPGNIPFLAFDFQDKIDEINRTSMTEIAEFGLDLGVNAVFENMPNIKGFTYKKLEDLKQFLIENDFKMCLDTGHANTMNYSPEEMYLPIVKHIHLNDNFDENDDHLALGEGNIDLKSIIKNYESNNYDGIYVIEVNNKESILKSLNYLKALKV